jgi:hypothetical protein
MMEFACRGLNVYAGNVRQIMRPKIVLAILLPALLVIGVVFFVKRHPPAPVPGATPAPAVSIAPAIAPEPPSPPVVAAQKTPSPEERQTAINAEIDRLASWAMTDDPQSLSNILGDLTSLEPEIRKAAIEAAKQFESTNAIPALKAAAANAENPQEAMAMLQAAEWLALPNADFHRSETKPQLTPEQIQGIEKNRAQAKARREARMQKSNPPNASQAGPPSAPDQTSAPGSNQ